MRTSPWSEDYPHCCTEELCPWCTTRWQSYCRSRWRRYEHLASSIWWLLNSLVRHALRLRTGTSKMFWTPWSIWDVPISWKMIVAVMWTRSMTEDYPHCCTEELCPWCTTRWQTYCRSRCRRYECLASSIWWILDSLVHHALRLRTGTSKTFWMPWSIWDVPRAEIGISDSCPGRDVWDLW